MRTSPDDQSALTRMAPTVLTMKMGLLSSFGLMMFGTGGCLLWTPPVMPLALPMLLIGLVMWIASIRKRETKS